MNIPIDLKYTKDHEWVKIDGDTATIGITDFAQGELGDIVYVDVDTLDETVDKDDVFGSVEAVKTVSDLFMPLTGEVVEFNEGLEDDPEIVNKDLYVKSETIALEIVLISDKTYHFIAYFLLMLSWLYAFFKKKSFTQHVKYIIIGCIFFGIIIEILQGITTTYRTSSFLDVVANTLGVVFASIVFHFFEKKIRLF